MTKHHRSLLPPSHSSQLHISTSSPPSNSPSCLAQKVCITHTDVVLVAHMFITVGTPKYLANKMKSKGLQRLRWYCQVCEKQCRDENGFKCHAASESHLRQMLVVGESAGKHISDYSGQFQSEFVTLLSRRSVSRPSHLYVFLLLSSLSTC